MKTKLVALALAASMLLTGCGADPKTINGVTYDTYGFINKDEKKNPNIRYEVSGWSIFWSIVLVETIIGPIYFLGFDLYEPVEVQDPNAVKGQIGGVAPSQQSASSAN